MGPRSVYELRGLNQKGTSLVTQVMATRATFPIVYQCLNTQYRRFNRLVWRWLQILGRRCRLKTWPDSDDGIVWDMASLNISRSYLSRLATVYGEPLHGSVGMPTNSVSLARHMLS